MSNPASCIKQLKSGLLAVLALLVVALPASAVNILVSGLNDSVSSEGLAQIFAEYGEVSSATVVRDPATGKSRGFGFVEMQDLEGRAAILALDQTAQGGLKINVKEVDRPDRDRPAPGGFGGGNRPRDPAPAPSANPATAPQAPTPPPASPVPTPAPEDAQDDAETQWTEDTLDPAGDTIADEEEEESDDGGAADEAVDNETDTDTDNEDSVGDDLSEDALESEAGASK